jgi:hypothetical protein
MFDLASAPPRQRLLKLLPKVREAPISCIAASSHRDRDRSPTHPVQIRAYSRTMHAFACSASEAINWQLPSCDPVEREKRGYGPHAGVASRAAPLLPAPRRHARVSINRPSTFEALSSQTIRSYVALTIPRAVAAMFARLETASVAGWMQSLGGNILHRIFQFGVSLMAFFFTLPGWALARASDDGDSSHSLWRRGRNSGPQVVGHHAWHRNWFFRTSSSLRARLYLAVRHGARRPFSRWGAPRLPFVLALTGIFGGSRQQSSVGIFGGPVVTACVLTIWRERACSRVESVLDMRRLRRASIDLSRLRISC